MSLSRFIGELLHERMCQSRQYDEAMRASLAGKPLSLKGPRPKREELYDPAGASSTLTSWSQADR